jgi:glycosyltransferase involved in cell wall biosynthesis
MTEAESRLKELIRGEELFSQGSLNAAKEIFLRLVSGPNPCKEALNNLGVIAFQEERFDEAVHYFTESLRIDPLYEDAVVNYSELQEAIRKSRSGSGTTGKEPPGNRTTPGHRTLDRHEATSLPGEGARIAVLCLPGLETFLGDIVQFLQSRYEVQTCYSGDGEALKSAVRWADIVWLEWGNQLAETLTHREGLLDGKSVICRVHSYEVLDGYLPRVNWSKITKTIFVAPHVLDIARRIYPRIMDMISAVVIPNGVDLDKFSFKERAPGFSLAVVGHVNNKKNPSLWPEIMHRLVRIDNRYCIKIAGAVQEVRYGLYLDHAFKRLGLEKHVKFFGHVENIERWFESEKVNYLLTTSIFESFGYGIAEAMAMGYRPLINHFPGADGLWPTDCLFSSVDDLVRLISNHDAYKPLEYRHFVEERYSLPQQMIKIEELINSVMESD